MGFTPSKSSDYFSFKLYFEFPLLYSTTKGQLVGARRKNQCDERLHEVYKDMRNFVQSFYSSRYLSSRPVTRPTRRAPNSCGSEGLALLLPRILSELCIRGKRKLSTWRSQYRKRCSNTCSRKEQRYIK